METKFDIKTKRNKIVRVKMKNIDSKKDSKRKNSIENHVWEKRKNKLQDTANLDERRGRRRENMKNRSHTSNWYTQLLIKKISPQRIQRKGEIPCPFTESLHTRR
jgi:lipopolysaccharide export LptBFGC system permease protein LptF